MNFKVFVCYSSKDEIRVDPVLRILKPITELTCYFFKETRTVAKDTREDILTNIRDSDAFLVFYSRDSKRSGYVQNEIGAAMGLGKQVIVCRLDKTKPKDMLDGVNYLDFYDPERCREELARLVAWIQEKIGQRRALVPVKAATEKSFDWVNFLLLAVIIAGSLYLISGAGKK